jgi:hypothetical protein
MGLFAGVLATGLAWPWISSFASGTALGAFTLPRLTGLSYGMVVAIVTGLGLAVFVAIERFGGKA